MCRSNAWYRAWHGSNNFLLEFIIIRVFFFMLGENSVEGFTLNFERIICELCAFSRPIGTGCAICALAVKKDFHFSLAPGAYPSKSNLHLYFRIL